jgi:prevent-host-death family protein
VVGREIVGSLAIAAFRRHREFPPDPLSRLSMRRSLPGYNGHMKMASISETKDRLSALIDRVRHGETVVITDRNVPVARLEPAVGSRATDTAGRLARLERAGVLRRGRGGPAREILATPPPTAERGASALRALLEERESGR